MKEEYKFAGFSFDAELYAKVERYGMGLLNKVLATLSDNQQWSIVEYMGDGGHDKYELMQRRFAVSPETVIVGCHNTQRLKGVRMQIQDPAGNDGAKLTNDLGVSYTERPAIISAFMDTFGEEGDVRFSRDLVVTCELTKRTEAIATTLIHRYLCDDLSYEAMAPHAQAVSDQEAQLWESWKAERPA